MKGANRSLVILFFLILTIFLVIFLASRTYNYATQSKYNSSGQNVVKIISPKNKYILHVISSKLDSEIKVVQISYDPSKADNLPILFSDGIIYTEVPLDEDVYESVNKIILGSNQKYININSIDSKRIYLDNFFMDRSKNVYKANAIKNKFNNSEDLNRIVYDKTILRENLEVSIINGTNISGLASMLTEALDGMGFNIVAVSSSDGLIPNTKIIGTEESYTLKKLGNFFRTGYDVNDGLGRVSDIQIIIGEDILKKEVF